MAKKAFVIGANCENLKHAVSGAEEIASALKNAGYEVIQKHQTCDDINILSSQFRSMVLNAGTKDTIIFYFSGHGKVSDKNNKTLFLILNSLSLNNLEETAFSFRDISNIFEFCLAHNKLIILDCCNATDEGINFVNNNYVVLRSSDSYTRTQEDPSLKASFLTHAFLKAVSLVETNEKSLSFYSLMQFLHQELKEVNANRSMNKHVVIQTGRISTDFDIIDFNEVKKIKSNATYNIENIRKKLDELKEIGLWYSGNSFTPDKLQRDIYDIKKKGYIKIFSIDELFEKIGLGNDFLHSLETEDKICNLSNLEKLACSLKNEEIIKDFCINHKRIDDILKRLKQYV